MKLLSLLSSALVLAAIPGVAGAETISNFNATVTAANSTTQLGRNSRSGIQQTWFGSETYTGVINTTTTYYYATYTFAASNFIGAPYIEITDYDSQGSTSDFLVAYSGSYNPANPGAGWLGDEGASGNYFGTNARYFDVILPVGQSLVLLFNNTAATGLSNPHNIEVDAYADTNYVDPIPAAVATPEPSTFLTLGTGLVGVAGAWRRRFKSKG